MKSPSFIQNYGLSDIVYKAFAAGDVTLQMKPNEHVIRASGAAIAGTVRLPRISECPLLGLYYIQATSVATGTVTVAPFEGAQATDDAVIYENEGTLAGGTSASEVISAANGWVLMMAAGDRWIVVADDLDAA
jgi:hypothetical protein